ncbi:MAG: acyltransferase [Ignavibacteria bacterium]|nr:acyltransferase [Ignavibacteria bacterium]
MRLKHLDFLRGIAVLLVLFRHYALSIVLFNIGWIGVDLFFVLSGFLVSGLLFKEYIKYGNIKPILFLIRRGLKIYPLFYFALILSLISISVFNYFKWDQNNIFRGGVIAEFLFLQNYFGHIWDHTWSLAVEEHFYFTLILLIFILTKTKTLQNKKLFITLCIAVSLGCLLLRFHNYTTNIFSTYTHVFATHLRIDSLMFGVLLSYFYHFHREKFVIFFTKYRVSLLVLSGIILIIPFIFLIDSFFMNTTGLTLLYTAFGIILSVMVVSENTIQILNKILGQKIVNLISKIGFYSYSIYLWHIIVLYIITIIIKNTVKPEIPIYIVFTIYFLSSIFIAIGASKLIEQRALKYRDKKYPSRSKNVM